MLRIRDIEVARGLPGEAYQVCLPGLSLDRGEVVAITGPSGCGKSTILELIGLTLRPDSVAQFLLHGVDLAADMRVKARGSAARLARVRGQWLGFVPQTGGLLPFMSVRQNIALPAKMFGITPASALAQEVVGRLGLSALLDHLPGQLSIGQRQRASFARAITHSPRLLLADEPTAALDPVNARNLFELIMQIVKDLEIAALIVTHEQSLVADYQIRRIGAREESDKRTVFDACA